MRRLIAEWEPQDAVLLTWPHRHSDWLRLLPEVEAVYRQLARAIARHARLVIAAPADQCGRIARQLLDLGILPTQFAIYPAASNDTWARDHGPLTVADANGPVLLDFRFNGWGGKFPAQLDNQLSASLHAQGAFPGAAIESKAMVLEGGAIETDGCGTLLTTTQCLLNANRNPGMNRDQIEARFKQEFGIQRINWLHHGYLAGDDTDSHIDTLARLCPDHTIAYVRCDVAEDEHFPELQAMETELAAMRSASGETYRLVPLPWPSPLYSEEGERLPATYANFLILNGAVLVPVYGVVQDELALARVGEAFPGYTIVGVNCRPLIEQHGSLHCITMQLPEGVLGR